MSTRVHTNIAIMPTRRLPQIFGDATLDAVTNAAPNTLNSNKPSVKDAMGIAGREGVISFMHDFTASDPDFTIHFWSDVRNKANAAKGWIKASEAATGHTKEVPAESLCTVTIPEGTPFFIQSDTAEVRNMWIGGSRKYEGNPNADLAHHATDDA